MGKTLLRATPATHDGGTRPAPVTETRVAGRRLRGKLYWGIATVLALGIVAWLVSGGGRDSREVLTETAGGRDSSVITVTAEPVAFRPVQRKVEAVGTLHGFEEITLSAKVEGRVRAIRHDMADRVKPGETLLEIDPTDYELSLQQAERTLEVELAKLGLHEPPGPGFDVEKVPSVMQAYARLENAQAKIDRMRRLAGSRSVSGEDVDNATSDYRSAQAEHANQVLLARAGLATIRMKQSALAVARQQMKDTAVVVPTPSLPVPGAGSAVTYAVSQRSVAEGSYARAGTEVFKLVLDQTLKLRVPVPERYSADVRLGQKAEVTTAAFARIFPGSVTRVSPAVDPATRTFDVEIQVPNPGGELKPGGFAKVAILTRVDEAATVPLTALVNFAGITKIFQAELGQAKEIAVTPGVETIDWVEIAKPALARDALVITSGQTVLADGTRVTVREDKETRRQGDREKGQISR